MADWDDDSPELEANLIRVLRGIRRDARARVLPTVESARQWHAESMQGLDVPASNYAGAFRGESGLERVQVRIGAHYGVAAPDVTESLARFEQRLQRAVLTLDERIVAGSELSTDHVAAIVDVCAWAHAEWIRIHPFANGNGRTARLWVNSIAMRYELPPFMSPRPRPGGDYAAAGESAMRGDWKPTTAVLRRLLKDFLDAGRA
jgi:hypothetical protein